MLTVYTKTHCPYCTSVKTLLKNREIQFEEINVEQTPDARSFLVENQHRTVPQLYYRGKLFVEGGFQGFSKLTEEQIQQRFKELDANQ